MCPAQILVVQVAQQALGAYGSAQLAQGQVGRVVLRLGIEALEHGGGRHVPCFRSEATSWRLAPDGQRMHPARQGNAIVRLDQAQALRPARLAYYPPEVEATGGR